MRKPILGVCYGVQSLNVWRSGTLVQHIESEVLHQRPEGTPEGTVIRHDAVVERESRLGEILACHVAEGGLAGDPELKIVVELVAPSVGRAGGRRAAHCRAFTADGVIEAVENVSGEHFVLGVQWHPERTYHEDACSRAIFAALVEAARHWCERMARGKRDFETAGRGL